MVEKKKVLEISKNKGFYGAHIKTDNGFAFVPTELLDEVQVGDMVTIYSGDGLSIGGFSAMVLETPTAVLAFKFSNLSR